MSPVDTDRFRSLLNEERARIVKEIEFLQEENPGTVEEETGEETHYDQHPADAATAIHDREVDYTIEEDANDVLRQIDAALERMKPALFFAEGGIAHDHVLVRLCPRAQPTEHCFRLRLEHPRRVCGHRHRAA